MTLASQGSLHTLRAQTLSPRPPQDLASEKPHPGTGRRSAACFPASTRWRTSAALRTAEKRAPALANTRAPLQGNPRVNADRQRAHRAAPAAAAETPELGQKRGAGMTPPGPGPHATPAATLAVPARKRKRGAGGHRRALAAVMRLQTRRRRARGGRKFRVLGKTGRE